MKRTLLYITTLLLLASCSESEYNGTRTPSLNRRYLHVSTTSLSFDAQSSSKKVNIESDQTDWNITIPVDWVFVNPKSGNNSATVDFTTQLNNSADESRVCVATVASNVNDWNRSFPITITQGKNSPYITLSESNMICSAVKQTKAITISANTEYTINDNGSVWLHVESATPSEILFSIDENNTGEERNAVVTLNAKSYKGVSATINVRQKIANISSTKETLNYGHSASSQTIEIESEASWTASSTGWLSVSPVFGNAGKTQVTISVPKNASLNRRNGSVYFKIADNNNIEVPVTQEGVTLNVSPSNVTFTSFGGSQSLTVASNDSWTVASKPEWVSIDKTSGEGNATIKLSTAENNTTSERNGEIVISTDDGVTSKTIPVKQEAKTVDYGDATLDFNYSAGSQSINFTTDGNWSLTKDAEWFSVDKTSGSGSATLNISVEENNTTARRNGAISLLIAGKPFTVTIQQDCKYVTLSSSAFTFSADAGNTKVSVGSNTQWNAKVAEGSEWLSVTPTSGANNADLTIKATENKTVSNRTGKIEIEIPNVHTYVIDVTQNRRYLKTDMASVDFLQSGGQISFNVTTDGTYEVTKIGTWFGYIKNGNTITVVAQENTTGSERVGALQLKMTGLTGGTYTVLVPVTQSASNVANAKMSGIVVEL